MEIEKRVFNEIKKYIKENGYSPSVRELCKITGYKSTATIYKYLQKLKQEGYIDYSREKYRAMRILKEVEDEL